MRIRVSVRIFYFKNNRKKSTKKHALLTIERLSTLMISMNIRINFTVNIIAQQVVNKLIL